MTSTLYQKQYENNKKELERIEKKLKELEKLSPEEQNKLYFKQAISEEIWRKKYKAKSDKSIVDTWKRVAKFLSQNEKKKDIWYLYFFDLLEGFKFTGAGRILANADFEKKHVSLANCYMSSEIEDSMEGIMEVAKEAALTQKMGGGIGYNFSTIRPKGDLVKSTQGHASGPISFAHIFDAVCRTIASNGNRYGAQMLQLSVSHPDIEEFITAKQSTADHAPLTRFNLSVQITDEFMKAVKEDKDWDLVFNGKVYKTVKARYLWDLITKHAYDYAEPGIFNIDIANKYNNLWFIKEERIAGTNPSLPAGTLVYTTEGIVPIETLEDKFFFTKNINGDIVKAKCFKSGNNKPVYKIEIGKWKEIEATPEHKFPVIRDKQLVKLPVAELKVGDRLLLPPVPDITIDTNSEEYQDGLFCGILFGDGYITQRKTGSAMGNYVMGFSFNQKDREIAEFVINYVNKRKKKPSTIKERNREKMHELTIQISEQEFIRSIIDKFGIDIQKKELPTKIWEFHPDFILGFINGWISTDGSVYRNSIIITNKYKEPMQQIAKLFSFLGIKSSIAYSKSDNTIFPNKKDYKKEYERFYNTISIRNVLKLKRLLPEILCKRKNDKYQKIEIKNSNRKSDIVSDTVKITNIIPNYRQTDVWDITVYDNTHTFLMEYGVTGNCGEESLPYNGSCNLGSFNLTQFVDNPFSSNSSFNFDLLSFYIPIAVRFMDNVIDLTEHPNEKFYKRQEVARRVGIGVTGLADVLVMLGVKFGYNNTCLSILTDIFKTLRDKEYESSVELSKEKGPAPYMIDKNNRQKFIEGNFVKQLPEDIKQEIVKHGIRNTFLSAIAPTGTISLLMNNVSSGIEPIFSNSYFRKVKVKGDITQEYEVMDYAYKLWKEKFNDTPLPDYWVTTIDLTVDDHLYTMATIQKYIDTATSKTISLPADYPYDDYKKIFAKAYELELKGVTVYRPNDKLDSVLYTKDQNDNAQKNTKIPESPKRDKNMKQKSNTSQRKRRPFMLAGRTYKLKTPKEKYSYYVTINDFIDDEGNRRPFEIFINTKDPRQPIFGFISRLLSALFRREKDIEFIIKEMQNTVVNNEGFFDPADGKFVHSLIAYIGKIIKKHIDDYDSSSSSSFSTSNSDSSSNSSNLLFFEIGGGKGKEEDKQEEKDEQKEGNEMSPYGVPWSTVEICPECGVQALVNSNGCKTCMNCGYSKCD